MNRHLSTEQLSSYMDGEVDSTVSRGIETHLEGCPACSARLRSMRGVVAEVRRMQRLTPPADLAYQVRTQTRALDDLRVQRTFRGRVRTFLNGLTLQPSFRLATALGAGLVLAFSVLLPSYNVPPVDPIPFPEGPRQQIVTVRTTFGEPPLGLPETTSAVAGRKFVLAGDRWVEKGLEGKLPETHVVAASPEGQAMLSKYSDLMLLLTDGSRVVLQYRLATVELSKS
ncbi:MAG TPA: zf-HC2 domain-containing protein [Thermoanaerobaculia bacterium]|nr:zf-HC2 domain-containing protein [Thermoanaerobaculia bacterium]